MSWTRLEADEHGDWFGKRTDFFGTLIPIGSKEDKKNKQTFFYHDDYSLGVNTNRDPWSYNFSKLELSNNIGRMISYYNQLVKGEIQFPKDKPLPSDKIKWTSSLDTPYKNKEQGVFDASMIKIASYRPFVKENLYYGNLFIHRRGVFDKTFPYPGAKNLVICVSGVGVTKDFSCIITDTIPDLELIGKSQCFPLYWYEEQTEVSPGLFDEENMKPKYIRHDAITDWILNRARQKYSDKTISKENIFYYVYGLLHSKDYRKTFSNDLKKMLPRIPLVDETKDFWLFEKAGRKLADLHLNYETPRKADGVTIVCTNGKIENANLHISKMAFAKSGNKEDRSVIEYNHNISITGIPTKAFEYVVNGKSPMEWMMEFYTENSNKKYKENGIVNDANKWCSEHHNPRYILDTLINVIDVSCKTVDIVTELPKLDFESQSKAED